MAEDVIEDMNVSKLSRYSGYIIFRCRVYSVLCRQSPASGDGSLVSPKNSPFWAVDPLTAISGSGQDPGLG